MAEHGPQAGCHHDDHGSDDDFDDEDGNLYDDSSIRREQSPGFYSSMLSTQEFHTDRCGDDSHEMMK